MRREGSIVGTLIFILFGPIVWALHLMATYAGHASLCDVGAGRPDLLAPLPVVLAAATMVAALLLGTAVVRPGLVRSVLRAVPASSPEAGFATRVMQWLVLLSLFGVTFSGLAMLILPLCQQLR
jgi:hypothetical protein